jgi:3-oxoadipate enol-lactonase/4-carboxymuconolactone decarboxylase
MLTSRADVATSAAERYAKQLASHLGRKARVVPEAAGDRIHIGTGSCLLVPGAATLELRAEAPDEAALDRVEDVVARHLVRFGRRNELVVAWERPPTVTAVELGGDRRLPLLICGPSLGTSAEALWSACAALLDQDFHVVGWDLPGHGRNREPAATGFSVADLAMGVLAMTDAVLAERGEPGGSFAYAGNSVGGAVGLQLLLDAPDRVRAAVVLCSAPRIGTPEAWTERAATVLADGTSIMVESSTERWFSPGFTTREPATAGSLLQSLQDADATGYAQVCRALAAWDVRDRLTRIEAPVLAVAGADDAVAPPADARALAEGVRDGRSVVLEAVAHLAPAEAPAAVARLIREHAGVPVDGRST